MANVKQQLDIPAIPSLGTSGVVYSQNLQNQNNGLLRLFFTKIVNSIQSVIGPRGGKFLNNPYGAFQSTVDQTATTANTAYAMTLNTTDYANGVSVASSSRITVADDGIWNLQWSGQFENPDTQDHDVLINGIYLLLNRKQSIIDLFMANVFHIQTYGASGKTTLAGSVNAVVIFRNA